MKKTLLYFTALLFFSSCIFSEDGDSGSSNKFVFVGSYFSDASLPDYTAKLTVDEKNGSIEVTNLTDIITQKSNYFSLWHNGFSRNGRVAYYAHESNFEDEESSQRWDSFMEPVFLDVSSGVVTRCPVPASPFETNLIPWVRSLNPIYIDGEGRIFYAIWYSLEYGDLHRPTIYRYNPETNEYTYTRGADAFVASQPERGNDTENGAFKEEFAISSDGRYAYCVIYGYGTDFGQYHVDYQFLVQYDFETHEITRLEGGTRSDISIYGINSDYSTLLYSLGSDRKYIDLSTRQISIFEDVYFSSYPHCSFSNTAALDAKTTGLYHVDFTQSTEEQIIRGSIYGPQFDKNGAIFFVLEGDAANYLCKKEDYNAETAYDTIAIIPTNLKYLLLVE